MDKKKAETKKPDAADIVMMTIMVLVVIGLVGTGIYKAIDSIVQRNKHTKTTQNVNNVMPASLIALPVEDMIVGEEAWVDQNAVFVALDRTVYLDPKARAWPEDGRPQTDGIRIVSSRNGANIVESGKAKKTLPIVERVHVFKDDSGFRLYARYMKQPVVAKSLDKEDVGYFIQVAEVRD